MPPGAPTDDERELAAVCSGSGRRVVLVHGFTQTLASWRRIAEPLSAVAEVLCVDLPDHGGSSEVHARSLEDAAALVGERGGRATYVGYSLGGRVCLTLALEHPELVEALVLIGVSPGIADPTLRAERRAADEALADRLDPTRTHGAEALSIEAFLTEWLAGPLFAHLSPEAADIESRRANSPSGLAASLRTTGAGTQRPAHGRLGELSMPVLLIAGADDVRYATMGAEMAASIGQNATAKIVEHAGHAVPFERPDELLAMLSDFLAVT